MPAREQRFAGVAGADGLVVGPACRIVDVDAPTEGDGGPAEQARALAALQATAARLGAASERMRAAGRTDDAEILEASQMMAEDPSLLAEVAALAASRPAVAALLEATEQQAKLLAAIPDPYLAARAADVRRLGRQAAQVAASEAPPPAPLPTAVERGNWRADSPSPPQWAGGQGVGLPRSDVVLIAHDLGPADFAEIELEGVHLGGIALAGGSVTSHAAIVARSLGVPLVVGLGDGILTVPDGVTVVLDGAAGVLVISPGAATLTEARAAVARQEARRTQLARSRGDGTTTADGHQIRLLVNASTERELLAGLAAGAEGVGLLRTELAFLDAAGWPSAAQHEAALAPVFRPLAGRLLTVRTLDFGADKTPPFLRSRTERGIALQLDTPDALADQLRGLLLAGAASGAGAGLRIMLPLVEDAEQIVVARELLRLIHAEMAGHVLLPPLGAMIESRRAIDGIEAIAAAADFLSIGTNDLVQDLLRLDRLTPAATVRAAADPRVLQGIRTVTAAARQAGRTVEVCGEAAGDPEIAVLLVGLGVTELSVAPSRLDEVRAAVRAVTLSRAAALADRATGAAPA